MGVRISRSNIMSEVQLLGFKWRGLDIPLLNLVNGNSKIRVIMGRRAVVWQLVLANDQKEFRSPNRENCLDTYTMHSRKKATYLNWRRMTQMQLSSARAPPGQP